MRVKLAQAGEGGGCTPTPLSLHLPSSVKLQCTLQLSGQIYWPCFISSKNMYSGVGTVDCRSPGILDAELMSGHISQGIIVQGTHRPRTFVRGHIGRGHIVMASCVWTKPVLHHNMRRKTSMKCGKKKQISPPHDVVTSPTKKHQFLEPIKLKCASSSYCFEIIFSVLTQKIFTYPIVTQWYYKVISARTFYKAEALSSPWI